VIVTAVSALTAAVAAVKVAVVAPAATVTEAGTWATAVLLELSVTTAPPVGAGPLSVTVPVEGLPPTTELRDRPTEERPAGVTVKVAVLLTLLKVAVIVAGVLVATGSVVAVKVAVVAPAATVTDAGTWAAAVLLEVSETAKPPVGAGLASVTVPVEGLPPMTEVGDRPTDVSTGGVTVKVAVLWTLSKVAVIVTGVLVATGSVVAVKVAVVAPAATVTDAGTWAAAGVLELSVTTKPPVGAGLASVTVPVEDTPPTTEVGSKATDVRTGVVTIRVAVWLTLLKRAVMVTGVLVATGSVVAVKVAVVAPAVTVTDAGTWATAVLLELRATTAPPGAAGLASVTVPVEDTPPATEVGFRPTEMRSGGVTVKGAVRVTLPRTAVIVTAVSTLTPVVVAVKVAVSAPANTVTDAGTRAAGSLELKVTTTPPVAAGPLSVTVPVEELPPTTEAGARPTATSTGAVTVRVVARLTVSKRAVIVTGVFEATGFVVAVKVAVVAPCATVTDTGTWAAAVLLEVSVTTAPPAGAPRSKVTVPVDAVPPPTETGFMVTLLKTAMGASTVSVAVSLTLLYTAVIVTAVSRATGLVVAVNSAVVAPSATVTDAGTWAAAVLLEVRVTIAPPAGAGPLKVTNPVEDKPPDTITGLTLTLPSVTWVSEDARTMVPLFGTAS
jgi:hypothetical protein